MKNNPAIKYLLMLLLIIGGCFADFHSKRWAESTLKGKQPATVIKGILELGFVENKGMVFGILNKTMPTTGKTVLVCFRMLILIVLTIFMVKYRNRRFLFHLPFLLIWAGALGNLIDPFIYGFVVDFIHIHLGNHLDWPFFFNLADAYLTVGIAIVLVFNLFFKTEIAGINQPR